MSLGYNNPNLFQYDTVRAVEELKRPAQSPDLKPTEHCWDELECWLHPNTTQLTSGPHLTNTLNLPSLKNQLFSKTWKHTKKIISDPSHPISHPGHWVSEFLPSSRCIRSVCTKTSKHCKSLFPYAVRLMIHKYNHYHCQDATSWLCNILFYLQCKSCIEYPPLSIQSKHMPYYQCCVCPGLPYCNM